jgi:hypothetical protein
MKYALSHKLPDEIEIAYLRRAYLFLPRLSLFMAGLLSLIKLMLLSDLRLNRQLLEVQLP